MDRVPSDRQKEALVYQGSVPAGGTDAAAKRSGLRHVPLAAQAPVEHTPAEQLPEGAAEVCPSMVLVACK